ncbi:hypothetical protein [Cetobacterium ceti]
MEIKDLTLFKPNQLIQITGVPLTIQGLLAYDYILHKLQQEKTDRLIISPNEILKYIKSEHNDELYKYLDSLQQTRIESRDIRGKLWGAFNLLAVFQKRENGIFIQIPEPIFEVLKLKDKEKKDNIYYTTIKLLEKRAFKCIHSIIFYDIFKKYEKINIPIFSIDELKELTGSENKYKTYADFKRYVLEKALKEINSFDKKYEYTFSEERLGRKINKIKFIRMDKDSVKIEEHNMSEKLVKAVLKARKNIYVDSSYSQKAMDKLISQYDESHIIKGLNELYKYNYPIENFSKILNSKIKDIIDSEKMKRKKESVKTVKIETLEKTELDIEKERISLIILNSKLSTKEKMLLFRKLSVIEDMKTLKELENICVIQ